jgi:hypothetical protein
MGTKTAATASAKAGKRAAMIAEAAYFAAEQRNFRPGDELADWLAAERMVDSRLKSAAKKPVAKKRAAKKAAAKKVAATKVTKKKK